MIVLSLGWGVQSFTMAAMSAFGDLPKVDFAIHADTTHERSETYLFAKQWTSWLEERGIKVITVRDNNPRIITDRLGGEIFIPAFTAASEGGGMLRRQCTGRWKIAPMRRWLQANRNKEPVEMWIGISTDEALRMKPSDVKYITNCWPLIEKGMSRNDCEKYLKQHGLEIPPKSACIFCPYHDFATWRELKLSYNGDWQKAVDIDKAIRKVRPPYDLYLHPSRKPLDEIDFRNDVDRGQLSLWDEECNGICGV
jgi:hypothetical protein